MAQPKTEVVKPLNEVSIKDINNSKQKIDKWLLDHTHQLVGLNLVSSVLGTVPIIGNVMAAIDVVTDIFQIYEKGYQNADVFDWTTVGIDLIGVAPVPGTTAIRTSARPALFLVRQEVKRVGKAALAEAVITVIGKHLNDQVAGNIEKFCASGLTQLNSILGSCGNTIQGATTEINGGIVRVVTQGKVFTNAGANATRAQQQAAGIAKGLKSGDLVRAGKNIVYMTENWGKALFKTNVNNNAKVVSMLVPQHLKQPVLNVGATISKVGVTANAKIRKLGNKAEPQTIGWLFEILRLGASRFRKTKSAQVKATQTTQAKNAKNNNKLEKSRDEHPATNNANQCKNCKGGTSGSISFAMGTEFLTHDDALIHPLMVEPLARSYISNLYQYDQSIFGARWTTPFSSKIVQRSQYNEKNPKENIELKGWEYIGIDGRPIKLRELKAGQSFYDEIETFTYTVVSDDIRAITFGSNESRYYQKYKNEFRLVSIERQNGFSVGLRYDHRIDDESYLSDIIFKQDQNILAHLALKLNQNKLVDEIWLVKDGQLKRQLSAYVYNDQADLIQATNEFGASYQYTYQHHLLTRYTDLTKRGMNLKWNGKLPSSKAIEEWADDYSSARKLEWDENVRVTTVTDIDGNVTEHYYGITGYTYRIIYPDNLQEWFFRDDAKNITSHVATDGTETVYSYDERGNVLTTTQADGATTYFEYDEQDQLIGMVDAEQGRWFKQYDGSGNLIKEIDPLKHETGYAYNSMGLVTSITDAKGGNKALKYDDQGNLLSYTDCSGKETKWQYDERGRVKSVENALKQKNEYFYTEITTGQGEPIIKGLPLNAFGQLEKIKHPDGSIEHFVHDAEGRLLAHVDPKQHITKYEYDAAGLISKRTDALNHTLKYQWDRLSRLKRLTNENGANYEFIYDAGGRLVKEIDFDAKETLYQYDELNGRLTTSIEVASAYGQDLKDRAAPKDRIQQFIFDSMGRLEQRTAGYGHYDLLELEAKQTEEFAYDYMGRILHAKNAETNLQWFYDAAGNVIKEHQQDYKSNKTAVWKHSYDEINDRIKTIRPDGQNIDWLTYGTGHVQSLIVNGQDLVSFERDDLHREIVRHYANGISQEQQFDLAGRLHSQIMLNEHDNGYQNQYSAQNQAKQNNALQQTSQLVQRLYQYDKTGELTAIKDTRRGNIAYKYDPVGRLLEASSKLGKETFSFDPASNIVDRYNDDKAKSHQQTTEEKGYGYNRLVNNVVKEYLDQQYQYDAYGQLVRQKSTQGDLNLEWDVYGRMIKSRNSQFTAEYRYDALGRRIQKRSKQHHTGDEHNIIYGWDGDTLAYESTEQATKHYIYEKDSFVPMLQAVYQSPIELHQTPDWSDKPYSVHRDPLWKTTKQSKGFDDVWFYHCDHLGTPQEMSDHTGSIIWKAEYKAWGECKTEKARSSFFENSEIISNNIRFQGQYFDLETGLHYNRYRYYSPYVGRFVSKDPIGLLGGNNVYEYASNPTGWIDPTGLKKQKNSQMLGQNVTGQCSWPGKQAHHLIPESLEEHQLLKDIDFKMNSASNGIMLPEISNVYISEHLGGHAIYTRAVKKELDHIEKKYVNEGDRKRAVQDLQRNLDTALRHKKLSLYKTKCGKPTGLKTGDWDRYIKSSRRY